MTIPIIKTQLPYNSNIYNPQEDSKTFTLYAGTKCIEARHPEKGKIPVLALATQTGFSTIKGELVIIYFVSKTSYFFVLQRFFNVSCSFSYYGIYWMADSFTKYNRRNQKWRNDYFLLPQQYHQLYQPVYQLEFPLPQRDYKRKRYTVFLQTNHNVAGKITIMCFDKTGTLTEDGLDLYGVRAIGYSEKKQRLKFDDLVINISDLL